MSDFPIRVQNGLLKQQRQLATSAMHLAQELLTSKYSASGGSRSFQRRWEPWRWRAWWLAIESWQWTSERIIEADPLTAIWEVAEELSTNHSTVVQHLKQIGKVKKLDKLLPHELMENKKNHCLEMLASLFLYNKEPFLNSVVTCDEKWILYDNQQWPALCLDQEAPKHFPKPNLHQTKVMVTVWWSDAHLIHYRFLNSRKTSTSEEYAQQINEIYWKLPLLQLILVNRKGSILLHNYSWWHVA